MVQLAKFVRFCLGLQAWLILAAPVLAMALLLRAFDYPVHLPGGASVERQMLRLGFDSLLGLVSGVAWWALRRGWPSARYWALAASALSLPFGKISIVTGLLGLYAFWRPEVVKAVSTKVDPNAAPKHLAGDGTHKFIEGAIPILALIWYICASIWWSNWGEKHGLPIHGTNHWLNFWLALYTAIFFHELGHLLAGLGSEMTLRQFQYGPLGGRIKGGKWRFNFVPAGLLGGGAVGMVPRHLKNVRGRMVMLILGGPVASLVVGSIATLMTLSAPGSPWHDAWRFFALLGTFCLSDFVVNLTPLRPESQYSDGAQIYQLMSNGPWADRHLAIAMVGSSLVTPLRPRDFDRNVLERAADSMRHGKEGLILRILLAMHCFDSGKAEEGLTAMRQAMTQDPQAAEALTPDTIAEIVFYEAAIGGDAVRAREWWQRVEGKGKTEKDLDYWKGRSALLCVEGRHDEARAALRHADEFARTRPAVGAYDFDRWCLDVVRQKLAGDDLTRLHQATAPAQETSVPA